MGNQKSSTTQSTSNEPLDSTKNILDYTSNMGLAIARNEQPFAPSTTSTVVPWSQQSQTGMTALENIASDNLRDDGLRNQMQDVIRAGGYNPAQQSSMEYLNNAGTNPFDLSGNQAYQTYRSNNLDDLKSRVNAGANAAGALGSDDNTGRLVRELSRAGNEMDMGQFARMDSLNAQRANLGQQGFNNMGTAYSTSTLPVDDMFRVGAMNEDLATRELNDQLRIEEGNKLARVKELDWLTNLASGGSGFGTQTTVAQQPGQNPFLQAAGYGSMGLGLLGGF